MENKERFEDSERKTEKFRFLLKEIFVEDAGSVGFFSGEKKIFFYKCQENNKKMRYRDASINAFSYR